AFSRFDGVPALGYSLGLAQSLDKTGTEQQTRQSGKNAQVGTIVLAQHEKENVSQAAALGTKWYARERSSIGDDGITENGRHRPLRVWNGDTTGQGGAARLFAFLNRSKNCFRIVYLKRLLCHLNELAKNGRLGVGPQRHGHARFR